MNFDQLTALKYATEYSRPRKVGTKEEKLVAQEITQKLAEIGYAVDPQPFQFSTVFDRILTAEILISLVLILVAILTTASGPRKAIIPTGLLLVLLLLVGPLNHAVQRSSCRCEVGGNPTTWDSICWKLGVHYQAKNLVASLPASSRDRSLPHLLLVAHYDSKSQSLPLVVRILLFGIIISGSLIFSGMVLINLVTASLTPAISVLGFVVVICGIPLLFLTQSNKSPGAIDNASGLGLVLHLAEVIARQPELHGRLGVTVLISGAEEMGVKGALAYVRQNEAYLRSLARGGGLHVLNFDGIGVDGKLYLAGGERRRLRPGETGLPGLIKRAADELDFRLGRFRLPGALFDHMPFAEEGYDAVSIIGLGKGSWSIHTTGDVPEKLHARGFEQAGLLALRVIDKLCGAPTR